METQSTVELFDQAVDRWKMALAANRRDWIFLEEAVANVVEEGARLLATPQFQSKLRAQRRLEIAAASGDTYPGTSGKPRSRYGPN